MSLFKSLPIACSLLFLAACSSTPNKEEENVTSKSAPAVTEEVQKETVKEKKIIEKAEEYSGVEMFSSCLSYVIITDDKFVGYKPRYFNFDEAVPKEKSNKQMSCVAGLLIDYPQQTVEVRGYTDNKGSSAYNLALSEKRSASIVDELISLGVAKGQLSSIGLGKSQQLNDNQTEEQSSLNRRVEFVIKE